MPCKNCNCSGSVKGNSFDTSDVPMEPLAWNSNNSDTPTGPRTWVDTNRYFSTIVSPLKFNNDSLEISDSFEESVYDVLDNFSNNVRYLNVHCNFNWYFDELDYIMTDMAYKYHDNNEIMDVIILYKKRFTKLMYKNIEKMQNGLINVRRWIDEIKDLQSYTNKQLNAISNVTNSEPYNIFYEEQESY